MNWVNDEKDRQIIEEQDTTIRLLTDLTKAGSWVINFAQDGSLASVQYGNGFRRLLGYSDRNDFPDEIESFVWGIYPEDREAFHAYLTSDVFDESKMSTTGPDLRFCR